MPVNLAAEIETVNEWIREGRSSAALRRLKQLAKVKIPRKHLARMANLAWRAGWANFAVRLLNPVVRPTGKSDIAATPEELTEYAAALTFIGAGEEAQSILDILEPEQRPEVWLFRAFVLFGRWHYAGAIEPLSNYIESPQISDYQRRVGKVNLLAALVHERDHSRARKLATELLEETKDSGNLLLRGNILELAAQNAIWEKKTAEAEGFLSQAEFLLRESEGLDHFYVTKWKAILEYLGGTASPRSESRLEPIRKLAAKREHWETLRDCDRFESLHSRNKALLHRLYFGTPFESFRKRLIVDFSEPIEIPERYLWRMRGASHQAVELDLFSGRASRGQNMKLGQLLHRLMLTMVSDFYRPQRIASLYYALYPGDYFNPVTSPHRVHEAMRRLRGWFATSGLPLSIEEKSGQYRLLADKAINIWVYPSSSAASEKISGVLRDLEELCGGEAFSAPEAASRLGIPSRTLLRVLREACERKLLVRTGQASLTRYSFRKIA